MTFGWWHQTAHNSRMHPDSSSYTSLETDLVLYSHAYNITVISTMLRNLANYYPNIFSTFVEYGMIKL